MDIFDCMTEGKLLGDITSAKDHRELHAVDRFGKSQQAMSVVQQIEQNWVFFSMQLKKRIQKRSHADERAGDS